MEENDKIPFKYKSLKLEKLNFKEFKIVDSFKIQEKNRIREIFIKRKCDIEEAFWFLQFIVSNFNNLQILVLDINTGKGPNGFLSDIKLKLLPNELSKLESLTIRSCIKVTNVRYMMQNYFSLDINYEVLFIFRS